ncbi:MAG: hypothetical protein IKK57_03575 [Clostridia bacterium]|nr:hypothetical protein [Clostridia bacterium]
MKHRTKRRLILLYTVLTVASAALCLSPWTWNAAVFGFVWPEVVALALLLNVQELTARGAVAACALGAGLLLHLAAPVCGCLRIYRPFKVLLCIKAVLSLAAFLLLPEWYFGLCLLLHGGLFVLTMIFFDRSIPENAPEVEIGGTVPCDVRLHPSQVERMNGGFPG